MTLPQNGSSDFSGLGLSSRHLKILQSLNITTPTPIQHQSIPAALAGKDILGIAQTGTGKTFAFGLPLIQRLDLIPGKALVVLPTRELAEQVETSLLPFCRAFGIKTAMIIGGASMFKQIRALAANPRVVVATPGRLIDLMQQNKIRLGDVSILVLDEADRMFDMGFAPQLAKIFKAIPEKRQTLLFSATMPQPVFKLTTAHMSLPVRIEVAPSGTTAAQIEQEIFIIPKEAKLSLLEKILQDYQGSMLVFSRTKRGAKKITAALKMLGHKAAEIHSDCSQWQRREALEGFKSGRHRVLVATDIAARGIDVRGIEVVVNYDLPDDSESYVHRIGRTGRAGVSGRAISFATPDQRGEIRTIERLIRKTLTVSQIPDFAVNKKLAGLVPDDGRPQRRAPSGPRSFKPRHGRGGGRSKRPGGPRKSWS